MGARDRPLVAWHIPAYVRIRYPPSRRDLPENPVPEPENPTIPPDRSLAVFCDFDGTFSMEDVGSTLAQKILPEKRARLWKRFEHGEFTAWTYAMALFDGLALPEKDLDRFLETIHVPKRVSNVVMRIEVGIYLESTLEVG